LSTETEHKCITHNFFLMSPRYLNRKKFNFHQLIKSKSTLFAYPSFYLSMIPVLQDTLNWHQHLETEFTMLHTK